AEKPALVEEVVNRLLDLVADDEDRSLPVTPQPEMPVVEEEIDAMLFRLNWIIDRAWSDDGEIGRGDLVTTGRARIGSHLAGHRNGRLGREPGERRPDFRGDLRFHQDGLKH